MVVEECNALIDLGATNSFVNALEHKILQPRSSGTCSADTEAVTASVGKRITVETLVFDISGELLELFSSPGKWIVLSPPVKS